MSVSSNEVARPEDDGVLVSVGRLPLMLPPPPAPDAVLPRSPPSLVAIDPTLPPRPGVETEERDESRANVVLLFWSRVFVVDVVEIVVVVSILFLFGKLLLQCSHL